MKNTSDLMLSSDARSGSNTAAQILHNAEPLGKVCEGADDEPPEAAEAAGAEHGNPQEQVRGWGRERIGRLFGNLYDDCAPGNRRLCSNPCEDRGPYPAVWATQPAAVKAVAGIV